MRWFPGTRILTWVGDGGVTSAIRVARVRGARRAGDRTCASRSALARRPSSSSRTPRSSGARPSTAASTRRSSRRIVSKRPLKSWRWSWIVAAYRDSTAASGSSSACSFTRSIVNPASRSVALGEVDLDVGVARQQLVGRDLVDLGEPQQPGHRDRALAALVRAEDRGLELEIGARLDVVQRQPLLATDRPQPFAYVDAMHRSPLPPSCSRPAGETIPRSSPLVDNLGARRARHVDSTHCRITIAGRLGAACAPKPAPKRRPTATGAVTARSTCGPTARPRRAGRGSRPRPGRTRPRGRHDRATRPPGRTRPAAGAGRPPGDRPRRAPDGRGQRRRAVGRSTTSGSRARRDCIAASRATRREAGHGRARPGRRPSGRPSGAA